MHEKFKTVFLEFVMLHKVEIEAETNTKLI